MIKGIVKHVSEDDYLKAVVIVVAPLIRVPQSGIKILAICQEVIC